MTLKGAIGNIVFFNAENGYTVFQLISDSDGGETTCVGYLPQLNVGQQIEVSGKIVTHQKFGEQFSVEKFSLAAPTGSEGLVRYLASGLIKGVGEATARLIVNSFGDDTLSVLENFPERLAELRGISLKKARAIGEEFNEHRAMQEQIMFLQSYDITLNTAIKIYRVYKDKQSLQAYRRRGRNRLFVGGQNRRQHGYRQGQRVPSARGHSLLSQRRGGKVGQYRY